MSTPIVSKRRMGFTSASVYRRVEPHAFTYLSERATFWIAVISVFAFVTGNMVGQHGWHVFWKSVLGEGIERTITFTGTVPPVRLIPDYERWGKLGGSPRTHTFRQVPQDLLVPLPSYIRHGDDLTSDPDLRRVYFVEHLGTYETGRGEGSHAGVDISLPEGTPVVSIANGIVEKSGFDPGGFGNYVVVKHPNVPMNGTTETLHSIYAHLSTAIAHEGDVVNKGDEIGLSGKTGNVTAPHLHFQLDRDDAPWHPYWLFTSAELRDAKLAFNGGIDEGLHRERGIEYTLDPMLFVQANSSYVAPVIAASSSSAQAAQAPLRALTIAERRQQRLAKRLAAGTLVAVADDAPMIVIPAESSSSSESVASVHAAATDNEIASVDIRHDGSFEPRSWEKITLVLLNAAGEEIEHPAGNRKFGLTTAFGHAEFRPAVFTVSDFKNGRLSVEVLPQGEQTLVMQLEPMKTLSKPMKVIK